MKIINLDGRRNVSGERVRQMRTKKRMTQADLAAKVQTTGVILEQDAISRIESGSRMVQDYELRPGGGAGRHLGLVDGRGRKIIMP